MGKLERVLNIKLYKWFIYCARPFWLPILMITFTQMLISAASVGIALASRQMIDVSVAGKFSRALIFLFLLAGLYVLNVGASALVNSLSARLNEKMTNDMQRKTIERLYKTEWLSVNGFHSGDILTRLTSDAGNVVNFWVSVFPGIIALGMQLILAFFALLLFDKTLAIFAFVFGPISAIAGFLTGRRLKKYQHKFQEVESRYRSKIQESIQNLLIIKTFNYENTSIDQIVENQNEKYKWAVKKSNISIFANIVMSCGYWIGYFAAFTWGAYRLSTGLTSFGTFTAFLQLVGQVQGPFTALTRTLPQFISNLASVERLMELEALELEKKADSPILLSDIIAGLQIDNISFGYNIERPVLLGLSFDVKIGEIVALVGVSGEGKTTIMRLLLSLLKPDSGSIYFNMDDGRKVYLSSETRSCFTYVPQGDTLFSGTIIQNLRVGKNNADLEEIELVLKTACAWEFVQTLPDKLETVIGESGLGLSEGQAQRLTIARALLKQSMILLLDEATSALDLYTEKTVLNNIKNMRPKRTCVFITHRLSVMDICDRVFRITEKKLEEEEKCPA